MVEDTLFRHSAPFVPPSEPSIAFSPGDGRAGSGCPSPRVSAPGAEGGPNERGNTVQNSGEDSFPLFCTVCKLVGRSIAVEAPLSCLCTASTA